jgi:hypothetical protein
MGLDTVNDLSRADDATILQYGGVDFNTEGFFDLRNLPGLRTILPGVNRDTATNPRRPVPVFDVLDVAALIGKTPGLVPDDVGTDNQPSPRLPNGYNFHVTHHHNRGVNAVGKRI